MAGGQLHPLAVAHGQFPLLGRVGIGVPGGAALEDGASAGGLHHQLRLEEPRLVLHRLGLGLRLAVHQEEGHHEIVRQPAGHPADHDLRLRLHHQDRANLPVLAEIDLHHPLDRCPIPRPVLVAFPLFGFSRR